MKNLLLLILVLLAINTTDSLATLKLTSPKGGEKFVAGSDTLITWEGILPTDTVKLEYSIDKGVNWQLITDKATGLQYTWKNVPKPAGEQCLIKIQQISSKIFLPQLEWQKTYGGSKIDEANCIIQTTDGGYIVVGKTVSNDGDVIGNNGGWDAWILKLDKIGVIEWNRCYGGSDWDVANSIKQTSDGGYIVVGFTYSVDKEGDPSGGMGDYFSNVWILKIDNLGNVEWQKESADEDISEYAYTIQETKDGDFIIAGSKIWFVSVENNVSYYKSDILVIKLKKDGNIEWKKSYDHDDTDIATSIQATIDGGYIIAGYSNALLTDINSNRDYLIIKLDKFGNIEWEKNYGGRGMDEAQSIQQTFDGGYIVFGRSNSNDGDITNNIGSWDYWVIKLNDTGKLEWQKSFGGSKDEGDATRSPGAFMLERSATILQEPDTGFVFAGSTTPMDPDWIHKVVWIVKLDKLGNIIWDRTYSRYFEDYATSLQVTSDGGYIIAGDSWPNYYIIKLAMKEEPLPEDQSDSTFSIVAPLATATDIDMSKCVINTQKDSTVVGFVYNAGTYKLQVDSIYLRGTDANDFSILWGSSKHIVKPTWGRDVRFRFLPSRIGLHFAEIVIITQSDTLIRRIQGEGVPPQMQVLNDVIDFGRVIVGTYNDTTQAVTIMNVSSGPLTIIKTKHNKPNDYDFSTLAGGGSFTLNSGDTAKLDLRFKPSAIGYTYGTLEFYTEGLSIPAVITLKGEGINKNPVLQAPAEIYFGLICSNTMTNYVPIFNNGGDTLRISEINITGINANEFSLNEVLPMKISPISARNIAIKFKPNSLEIKSADLEIKSNSDPNTNITIPITAKRDSLNLSFVENTIDLGYLCPGEIKDTTIHIKNLGNIKSGAYLTNSHNISFGKSEITVVPNNTENISFRFNGLSTDGIINETITLTDSICSFSKTITITGIIQAPKLESAGIVITCIQLTSNDGILTLKNTSDRSIIIQNPPIISSPFSFVGNPFPLSIPANSSKDITLRYTPTEYISQSCPLRFFVEPCGITYETTVIGDVSLPKAVIKIDTLGAYPGEIINIPIILKDESYLELAGENSFQTDLVFNPTLLTPNNRTAYPVQSIDDKQAKIEIKNIPLTQEIGKTIIEIPFVVGLGNAESCELLLQNANVISGKVNIETESGKFKLLGICREGGTRLISPSGKTEILSIIPNPASDIVEIKVYLIEKGVSTIALYNSNGVKLFDEILNDETGLQIINLDLKNYDSGLYFIKLHTPTVIDNKKLMIVK